MNLGDAVLTLKVDDKGFTAGMKDAKEKATGLQVEIGKLVAAFLTFETVKKVVDFLKDCFTSFLDAEKAATLLTSALRSTGQEFKTSSKDLINYANRMQSVSIFTDEAIERSAALLIQLGDLTTKGVKEIMPAIMDLATALGIDLETATMLATKALGGNVGALKRYGIDIEPGQTAADRFKNTIDGIEKGLNGTSDALAKTTGGQLTIFKNQLDDLKEGVGGWLAEIFLPAMQNLNKAFDRMAEDKRYAEAVKAFKAGTSDAAQDILYYTGAITDLQTKATALLDLVNNAAADPFADAAKAAKDLKDVNRQIAIYYSELGKAQKAQRDIADEVKAKPSILTDPEKTKKVTKALRDLGAVTLGRDMPWSGEQVTQFNKWEYAVREGTDAIIGLGSEMGIAFDLIGPALEDNLVAAEDWAKGWQTSVGLVSDGLKTTFEFLGKALVTTGLTWADFGNVVLGVLGDIVIALGDQLAAEAAIHAVKALVAAFTFNWVLAGAEAASAGLEFAGAAAAWIAGAAIKSSGGFAHGADFVVPPGYENDSYPMRVQSGEHVSVTPSGEGGSQEIHVYLDSQPILDAVTRGSRNGRVLIRARSVVA